MVDASGASTAGLNVAAGDDFHHTAVVAGLAAAGVAAVSPAAGVTVVGNVTQAYVADNASVNVNDDVRVQAHGCEDILLVGFGVSGALVAIGGAVSVLSIDNAVSATIGAADVDATGNVVVLATDDTDLDVISGALAGGLVGLGGAVGVVDVAKATTASIASNAHVDAKGQGTPIAGINRVGVIVQADSSEDYTHFAVAAAGGFVGAAGGVSITLIDSDTTARISENAQINQADGNDGANALQDVYVNAQNELRGISFAGSLAVGFVGVAGAVDFGSVKNDTLAEILGGARVSAANDVHVDSHGVKDLQGFTFSGAGGLVAPKCRCFGLVGRNAAGKELLGRRWGNCQRGSGGRGNCRGG